MKQKTQSEVTVNESKHTPGPWRAMFSELMEVHWIEADGKNLLSLNDYSEDGRPINEAEANASLIAAAPDMLEALKELSQLVTGSDLAFHPANVKARTLLKNLDIK